MEVFMNVNAIMGKKGFWPGKFGETSKQRKLGRLTFPRTSGRRGFTIVNVNLLESGIEFHAAFLFYSVPQCVLARKTGIPHASLFSLTVAVHAWSSRVLTLLSHTCAPAVYNVSGLQSTDTVVSYLSSLEHILLQRISSPGPLQC